jgi:hypothetical protein
MLLNKLNKLQNVDRIILIIDVLSEYVRHRNTGCNLFSFAFQKQYNCKEWCCTDRMWLPICVIFDDKQKINVIQLFPNIIQNNVFILNPKLNIAATKGFKEDEIKYNCTNCTRYTGKNILNKCERNA